jgi:protein TonB
MKKALLAAAAVMGLGSVSLFGSDTIRPDIVEKIMPAYPIECASIGMEGKVIVEGMVNERGELIGANVVMSTNDDLAEAALAAVSTWRFTPATKDGVAVPVIIRQPVEFKLTSERTSHMDPSLVAGL